MRWFIPHRQNGFANILVLFGALVTTTAAATFTQPAVPMMEPIPKEALVQLTPQETANRPAQMAGLSDSSVDEAITDQTLVIQPEISKAPTLTPTPIPNTPTPTRTPTLTPTILPHSPETHRITTPSASLISTTPPTNPTHSLSSDKILSLINAHRGEKGLPALVKDDKLCALAQSRGPELYDEIFVNHNIHAGFYKRNLPYWITENMASYGSEEAIVSWWLRSSIHRKAIEGSYTYSCGTCWGNSCNQLFTNYTSK